MGSGFRGDSGKIVRLRQRVGVVRDYLVSRGVPAGQLEVTASGKYPVRPDEKLDRSRQRCVTLELIM